MKPEGDNNELKKKVKKQKQLAGEVGKRYPTTVEDKFRRKHWLNTLICKHSGPRWREVQRTKWVGDLLDNLDMEYRELLDRQDAQIAGLQAQLALLQSSSECSLSHSQAQVAALSQQVKQLESLLHHECQAHLMAEDENAMLRTTLQESERAAMLAVNESTNLQQAMLAITDHTARSRHQLAERACKLRDMLKTASCKAREQTENERKHHAEIGVLMHAIQQAANTAASASTRPSRMAGKAGHHNPSPRHRSSLEAFAGDRHADINVTRLKLEAMGIHQQDWTHTPADCDSHSDAGGTSPRVLIKAWGHAKR